MKKKNCLTSNGYVRIWNPSHPLATKDGNVLLHRMVYFDHHGSIPEGFHIHHRDGNKQNNKITNLQAISNSDHHREHHSEGDSMRNQYGECKVKPLEQRISHRKEQRAIPRQCPICGEMFAFKRSDAKYCSDKCRNRFHSALR